MENILVHNVRDLFFGSANKTSSNFIVSLSVLNCEVSGSNHVSESGFFLSFSGNSEEVP